MEEVFQANGLAFNLRSRMLTSITGWVMGVPETEEAQNRIIALKNKAVVLSVDYRKSDWIRPHGV